MTTHPTVQWFWRKLRALSRCEQGNVAMIFGLAFIPLIGGVGAAVDYSRAASARTAMQAALDASALILSKEAQTLPTNQLESRALAVFEANFRYPSVKGLKVTPTFTQPDNGSFKLEMKANGSVDTTIASIWQPSIDISASTEAVWGMRRIELALALDNTGSMSSSNKMRELKKAAKELVATLQKAAKKADDVRIAIIPFATDVNVGTTNVNAGWIRWTEWEKDNINFTCTSKSGNEVTDNRGRRITNEGDCKDRDKNATWKLNPRSTWNGCVWDRDQNNDVNNTATSNNTNSTKYVAHRPIFNNSDSCPVAMMQLTNNWSALNSKIDSMNPVGATNVTIGLQVAFQALSPVAPFNASSPKEDLDKVIILLTDGDNTENRWVPFTQNKTQVEKIDARTRLACTNAKDANIKIYTVRVINGNTSLLRECATSTDMFFDVEDASQLSAVFSTIAQNLANLRLSR